MYPKKVCTSFSYEKKGLECPRLMRLVRKNGKSMLYIQNEKEIKGYK
jgi:hypothetical protein